MWEAASGRQLSGKAPVAVKTPPRTFNGNLDLKLECLPRNAHAAAQRKYQTMLGLSSCHTSQTPSLPISTRRASAIGPVQPTHSRSGGWQPERRHTSKRRTPSPLQVEPTNVFRSEQCRKNFFKGSNNIVLVLPSKARRDRKQDAPFK